PGCQPAHRHSQHPTHSRDRRQWTVDRPGRAATHARRGRSRGQTHPTARDRADRRPCRLLLVGGARAWSTGVHRLVGVNPTELATSGPLLLAGGVALVAGMVSFASPCVVPLVPGYLAYLAALVGADAPAVDG